MQDKLFLEQEILPNGIQIHWKAYEVAFARISIQIPVGSVHSTEEHLPGTFHFLEHLLMLRSKRFPGYKTFDRLVGLSGGFFEAYTSPFHTTYVLIIPTKHLEKVLPGFFSQIFEPVFDEEDFLIERGVVESESHMKERWFPASSELGHYLYTQWLYSCPLSLRQRLGTTEDRAQLGIERMRQAHTQYFQPGIQVIAGGSGDISWLKGALAGLVITPRKIPAHFVVPHWHNQNYTTHTFRDVSRHLYYFGGIVTPSFDVIRTRALIFIIEYLTNPIQGELFHWLVQQTGWCYNLNHSVDLFGEHATTWHFAFPLPSPEVVELVRKELPARIEKALQNEDAIKAEVARILDGADVFWLQTLESILGSVEDSLANRGRIITEQEWRIAIKSCEDPAFLREIWRECTTPEKIGSFYAAPA